MGKIRTHKDLDVYNISFDAAMDLFELSKNFPREELYSLTDQIRRSSRSVSGNIAEAWRFRRYPKSFISKLSISEGEAAETQVWLDYSFACKYISEDNYKLLTEKYDFIIGKLVNMIRNPEKWSF